MQNEVPPYITATGGQLKEFELTCQKAIARRPRAFSPEERTTVMLRRGRDKEVLESQRAAQRSNAPRILSPLAANPRDSAPSPRRVELRVEVRDGGPPC